MVNPDYKGMTNGNRGQQGLSLVELMVSLLIALLLGFGVIQIFVGSHQTYRLDESMARVQENGRYAIEAMKSDIRQAGNFGCLRNLRPEPIPPPNLSALGPNRVRNMLNGADNWQWDLTRAVDGHLGTGAGHLPALPAGFPAANQDSDVLHVRGTLGGNVTVVQNPALPAATIGVTPGNNFNQFDIVMVGDCISANVFQIRNANPNTSGQLTHNTGGGPTPPGNAIQNLGRTYGNDAEVMAFTSQSFYVAPGAGGLPSLWRRTPRTVDEMVEGVERMRVWFGVDLTTSEQPDRVTQYMTAQQVENDNRWNRVVAVRLSLLLMSPEDNVVPTQPQITFGDETWTPADRRLRKVVDTTIGLRNRLP